MKKIILLLSIIVLIFTACDIGQEKIEVIEFDNNSYSDFQKYEGNKTNFMYPKDWNLGKLPENELSIRTYLLNVKPSRPSRIYITIQPFENVEIAENNAISRHKEMNNVDTLKNNIVSELSEFGYERVVTSTVTQKSYKIDDKIFYNTTFNVETQPEKISVSYYFFSINNNLCQARLLAFNRDLEKDDLILRKIINSLNLE